MSGGNYVSYSTTEVISYMIGWITTAWLGWYLGGGLGQILFLFLLIHAGRKIDEIIAAKMISAPNSIIMALGIVLGVIIALMIKYTISLTHSGIILAFITYLAGVYVSMIKYPIDLYWDPDNMKLLNGITTLSYMIASAIVFFMVS